MEYGDFTDMLRGLVNDSEGNCTPIPDGFFDKYSTSARDRQIGVSAAYGVICSVGLIANAIVMFLLLTGGKKGTTFKAPSTILIMNLAVADTLFLLTLPFAISHRLEKGWKFGAVMCKLEEGVKFLNYYGSVFFITAMAVDRYLVVSRPSFLKRKVVRKYMLIVSAVLWLLAFISVIPLLIFAGVDQYGFCSIMFPRGQTIVHNSSKFMGSLHQVECVEDYLLFEDEYYEGAISDVVQDEVTGQGSESVEDYIETIDDSLGLPFGDETHAICKHPDVPSLHSWLIWNFLIGFVVPFFIISVCYGRMMMLRPPVVSIPAKRQDMGTISDNGDIVSRSSSSRDNTSFREDANKLIDHIDQTNNNAKSTNQKGKILMNILVPCLIAAFAICWMPYHIFHLLQINGVQMSSDGACHVARDITFCLAFFNSALNPILNSFFLYSFKQRIQESKTWVSNQLKTFKKKTNRSDAAYKNGFRPGDEDGLTMEATMMTAATGFADEAHV